MLTGPSSLKIVHVAPASPTIRGELRPLEVPSNYFLADKDLVIAGLRVTGSVLSVTHIIPDIVDRPDGVNGKNDYLGHGFLEIYINRYLEIGQHVNQQIDYFLSTIKPPIVTEENKDKDLFAKGTCMVDIGVSRDGCYPKINNANEIVGCIYSEENGSERYRAFFFANGQREFLGDGLKTAPEITDSGAVLTVSSNAMFIWKKNGELKSVDAMLGIGYKEDDIRYFYPRVINTSGQMIGQSNFFNGGSDQYWCSSNCETLFSGGVITNLETALPKISGTRGFVNAINEVGSMVMNHSRIGTRTRTGILRGAVLVDIGTLGGDFTLGHDINEFDHVVGASGIKDSDEEHAFIYSDGVMKDIGHLGGLFRSSNAQAINDFGYVVGSSTHPNGGIHAFVWHESFGMYDLNELFSNDEWNIKFATDISNDGLIVGLAYDLIGNEYHAIAIQLPQLNPRPH